MLAAAQPAPWLGPDDRDPREAVVPQAVTLADVARHAGVSLATASRVLNGSSRVVGSSLRERVLTSAAELSYEANAAAQAIVRGHLDVVGVVVPDIVDPYFSTIAAGIMARADEAGLMVALSSTSRRPELEAEYAAAIRRQTARALVVVGSRTTDRARQERLRVELEQFEARGGRVALVSQGRLPFDTVALENRAGARALADALVDLGHRRFAVLAGPLSLVTSADRLSGFRQGLAARGVALDAANVVIDDFTRDGGYDAMGRLLSEGTDATCVFAVNDVMAVGAMSAARDAGVSVPDDLAVAGFDDVGMLRDVAPRLTTVRVDLHRLGREAMEMVLKPRAVKPRLMRVKCEVVVRESTPQGAP